MSVETIEALINLGAAGAVIIVVVYFLKFIRQRDRDWQNFFTGMRKTDQDQSHKQNQILESLVDCIKSLDNKFDVHSATELEILRGLDKTPTQRRKKNDTPG